MNIYDVLYSMNTGNAEPKARPFDNLLGQALSGGTEEKTVDWTPVISVSDALAKPVVDYQFKITAKQTGTGDPSPTNIRSIDGWTGAEITRAGKNLFLTTARSKEENGITYTVNADGTISVSGTATGFSSIICGDADISGIHGKITVSGIATATNMVWSGIRLYDSNDVQLYDTGASSAPSITIDLANYPTAVKLTIVTKRQNNVSTSGVIKPQVEGGDTAHDFEPYETPTVYPVSWQSEAGTVYGGTLDVTTGTLTVDYEYRTILSADLLASDKNYCSARLGELGYVNRDKTALCNMLTQWTGSASSIPVEHFMVLNSNGYNRAQANILFDGCNGNTPAETLALNKAYLEALEANDDYLTLCFALAEPLTYTLTPTEITLAEGANTIWADTGDSKLTYLAKK